MEFKWLSADLAEVKGAPNQVKAFEFAKDQAGRTPSNVLHVALSIYQIQF
jgi:hypothetical protein